MGIGCRWQWCSADQVSRNCFIAFAAAFHAIYLLHVFFFCTKKETIGEMIFVGDTESWFIHIAQPLSKDFFFLPFMRFFFRELEEKNFKICTLASNTFSASIAFLPIRTYDDYPSVNTFGRIRHFCFTLSINLERCKDGAIFARINKIISQELSHWIQMATWWKTKQHYSRLYICEFWLVFDLATVPSGQRNNNKTIKLSLLRINLIILTMSF